MRLPGLWAAQLLVGPVVITSIVWLCRPSAAPSARSAYSVRDLWRGASSSGNAARPVGAASVSAATPRHVYIDCTWADSFPPPRVVKFRGSKLWQWHTWLGGAWPRKALVFGQSSAATRSLRRKEAAWIANRTLGLVKVFTETRVGSQDGPGTVNLARLLARETAMTDYVVVKINMRGQERNLFTWLAGTPAFALIDAIYYEDARGGPVPGLETFRRGGVRVTRARVDGAADLLFSLHPDRYHPCWPAAVNTGLGLGSMTSNASMSFERDGHTGREAWNTVPTPIAEYDLAPWKDFKLKDSFDDVSNPKGRFAVVTVVAVLGSKRNDVKAGSAEDLMMCSALLHYLAFREYSGFLESDPVDYVLIHTGVKQEVVDAWQRFGIKTLARDPVGKKVWQPYHAGGLFKIHAVGLTEYSRILVIDNDMYISRSIRNVFLADYEEDFVTAAVVGTPLTANFMILRPNENAYELLQDLVNNRKFDYGRGWNPDDPRSGLFMWPVASLANGIMMCDKPDHVIKKKAGFCAAPGEFYSRCAATRATTWVWTAAEWDQGIFLYVFNVSGLGSTRWVAPDPTLVRGEIQQGFPFFRHYQGHCKPHLVAAEYAGRPPPRDCVRMRIAWFWDTLWKRSRDSYKLAAECPSFDKYDKSRIETTTP